MSYDTTDGQPGRSLDGCQNIVLPTPLGAPRKLKERRIATDDRRRAIRACDQCRRVKEKCEGGVPCRRCLHFKRACESTNVTPRTNNPNLSPRGPLASSTSLRGQRERTLRERARYMERILNHEIKGISLDTESLRVRAEAILEEEERHSSEGSPSDSSYEDLAIKDEACTIDFVEGDTAAHYSGEFSYWNFSKRIKRQLQNSAENVGEHSQYADSNSDYVRARQLQSGPNNLSIAISCCPPRPIADFLVRVFFDFADTHYFYIAKGCLLEKLDIIYNNPTILSIKDAGTISTILTVLAIGTQYAYLDSHGQRERVHTGSKYSEDEVGTMFYQQAIRLLPEIIESSTLESVQACLLFGVYALSIDASGLGYVYVNLALRLGIQNGMHRKYTGSALSSVMIETRNRIWWTAYALERKICIFHGRPLSMLRSDIDADLPQNRGDIQGAELPSNVDCMHAAIYLTYKLEDYFNQMILLRTYQKQEIPSLLARLLTIKTELQTWWSNLPALQEQAGQNYQEHHRSTMHLRLEFCLIRMFVGRPFLLGRQSAQSKSNSPVSVSDNQTTTNSEKRVSARQQLVDDCVQAAKEALEICRSLRNGGHGLARGSYIEYSSCRASLLVLIAYCVQNQSSQFRTVVQDGLIMIRDMSTAGDSARSEVAFIEALERTLKTRDDANAAAPGSLSSDYDSFKHWESMWTSDGARHPPMVDASPITATILVGQPEALTSAWGSLSPTLNPINLTTFDWQTSILSQTNSDNFFAMPNSDMNLALHCNNDMGLYEGENHRLESNGSILGMKGVDEFITNTDFGFNS